MLNESTRFVMTQFLEGSNLPTFKSAVESEKRKARLLIEYCNYLKCKINAGTQLWLFSYDQISIMLQDRYLFGDVLDQFTIFSGLINQIVNIYQSTFSNGIIPEFESMLIGKIPQLYLLEMNQLYNILRILIKE